VSEAAPAPPPPSPAPERVRIWDWPTRAFHWLLVLLIPALWWTAKNDRMELHVTLGVVMAALLLFRLIWGVVGSSTARFSNFIKGPRGVLSYLNGRAAHALGHNPIGGWSVAGMLALLTTQVGLGLFASDDDVGDDGQLVMGPFSLWLEDETVEWVTETHEWLFYVLLALIALHIAAILFYALKRRNLVGPMLTGRGAAPHGTAPMQPAPAWRLLLALMVSGGIGLWLWSRL
jgi:cytochrome b